ncbi:hypothetical protein FGB62_7g537 [Gracilaria domingensis]|nr:hypothetical protein FGB62_7g537 [Gracilaria domingensis]
MRVTDARRAAAPTSLAMAAAAFSTVGTNGTVVSTTHRFFGLPSLAEERGGWRKWHTWPGGQHSRGQPADACGCAFVEKWRASTARACSRRQEEAPRGRLRDHLPPWLLQSTVSSCASRPTQARGVAAAGSLQLGSLGLYAEHLVLLVFFRKVVMMLCAVLLVVGGVFSVVSAQRTGAVEYIVSYPACVEAYSLCDWTFYNRSSLPTFDISVDADKPFSPVIVSKNKTVKLTVVNSNNAFTEFVFANGVLSPSVYEGTPRFGISTFKPFQTANGSRLTHEKFEGNQLQVASGSCLRTYFSEYQQLVAGRYENVKVARFDDKCVVYWTQAV